MSIIETLLILGVLVANTYVAFRWGAVAAFLSGIAIVFPVTFTYWVLGIYIHSEYEPEMIIGAVLWSMLLYIAVVPLSIVLAKLWHSIRSKVLRSNVT